MEILICGDIFPDAGVQKSMMIPEPLTLLGEKLFERFREADFVLANLETPLTDEPVGIVKNGPILSAPVACAVGLKAIGVSAVTLANNHIMDCGESGFQHTLQALKRNEIAYFGAGKTYDEARKGYVIEKEGVRVGVYACAEHEFSIVSEEKSGANPFVLHSACAHIRELKKNCDRVLVLFHGGKEYYRYPSPDLQYNCRNMVDAGADLVICQHSHCVGCKEEFEKGVIVYGQGNFLFPGPDDEYWNNGLVIEWSVDRENSKVDYVPFNSGTDGICKAEGENRTKILDAFFARSNEICDPSFVNQKYKQFAKDFFSNYVSAIFGYSKWERRWDRYVFKGRIFEKKLNQAKALALLNFIECEAHRELIAEGLRLYVDRH